MTHPFGPETAQADTIRGRWIGWRAVAAALLLAGLALRLAALDRPFWMDESFSAALAAQPPAGILRVCAKDVHPPLYYLALRAWNAACRAVLRSPTPAARWRLVDFNLGAIETAGVFQWEGPDGRRLLTAGVFPHQPLEWGQAPLAPLPALRVLGVLFGLGAAFLTWRLGRRLDPARPSCAALALALFVLNGYTLTWDTVIRSYSASALAVAALALAGLWTAETGRWRIGGPLIAALVAASFLTNYVSLLLFPGLALAVWLWAGADRRALFRTAGAFAAGALIVAALWGGAFLSQTGRVPTRPLFHDPVGKSLGRHFSWACEFYWGMLFADGMWGWLAAPAGKAAELNPLRSLSPETPLLTVVYFVAFALYAAAISANLWGLARRPTRRLAVLSLLALPPGAYYVVVNLAVPHSLPLYGRHLYPAAPFFYLFLAHGWVSMVGGIQGTEERREKTEFRSQKPED